MARRRGGTKLQPAVETMVFQLSDASQSAFEGTIDLSQCASILNRRFYRQGLNWYVQGFELVTTQAVAGAISLLKLHNTWVTGGAWEKTMRAWLEQQNEALENLGEVAPAKYRDFKIHMDPSHVTSTFANNMLPLDVTAGTTKTGEWEASQIVIPNNGAPGVTQEFTLHMNGASSATSKAMISNYANSRNMPFSPDPVHPTPLDNSYFNQMFDVGNDNDEVINNATDKNDNLPYDQDDYPGEDANYRGLQFIDTSQVTSTTIGGTTRMVGTNVPCGLVRVAHDLTIPANNSALLIVRLVPGTHRGYMCEKMEDF